MFFWLTLCRAAMAAPDSDSVAVEVEVRAPDETVQMTTAAVTVVAVDDRVPPSSDLSTLVSRTAGTSVRRLGGVGAWTTLSIRGSSARQVDVFIDGVPLNPDGLITVNLAELPLRTFERVEIYRGFTPVWLGSSAIGGAINLVSAERPKGQAALSAGSLTTSRASASGALDLGNGLAWMSVEALGTRGDFSFFDDRGTAFNTGDDVWLQRANNDRRQGSVHASYQSGPWRVLTAASFREEGIPGVQYGPYSGVRWSTARDLTVGSWQHQAGAWSHRASVWGLLRQEYLSDPLGEVALVATGDRSRMTAAGAIYTTSFAASPRVVWSQAVHLGIAGWQQDLQASNDPSQQRLSASTTGGLTLRDPGEFFQVSPVVKVGRIADRRGREPMNAVSPRISVLWAFSRTWALSGNAGLYLRPPDLLELYGNQGVFVGNSVLSAERGRQGDVGVRGVGSKHELSVVAFANDVFDQIVWLQNAQGLARPSNLAHARTLGTELASAWRPGSFDLRFTGTRNWAVQIVDDTADLPIPGVPEWELHTDVRWQRKNLTLGHRVDYTFGSYLDAQGFFGTPPRTVHAVSAALTDGALCLQFELLNALNQIVESTDRDPLVDDGVQVDRAVTDFFGYPLPGRTVLLTLRYQP